MENKDLPNQLSMRQYSEHRRALKLRGYSLLTIQDALKHGRISRTCDEHDRCPYECKAGKIDPVVADADWIRNTTPGADRSKGPAPELLEAKVLRETWAGRNERLKFEERAGSLVRAELIQQQLYARGRQLRESLAQVRLRICPVLATEKDPRKIDRLLETEFREVLKVVSR